MTPSQETAELAVTQVDYDRADEHRQRHGLNSINRDHLAETLARHRADIEARALAGWNDAESRLGTAQALNRLLSGQLDRANASLSASPPVNDAGIRKALEEAEAMAREVRDLLLERISGSPARSAAHNARVRTESLIAHLAALTDSAQHPAPAGDAALRKALRDARDALLTVGNDYPGSSCQQWCTDKARETWNVLEPWRHCPSTHCERALECRSVNECSAERSTLATPPSQDQKGDSE